MTPKENGGGEGRRWVVAAKFYGKRDGGCFIAVDSNESSALSGGHLVAVLHLSLIDGPFSDAAGGLYSSAERSVGEWAAYRTIAAYGLALEQRCLLS